MKINIDISNYEEYLLSAVDGELSGEELAALEVFLQQHPHIREELVLLESVKIIPDADVRVDFKNELYHESIQLLDYVDGELHGTEKQAFEALVQQNAALTKELNLLQRAKLQPDLNLLFEDKASLYKYNKRKIQPVWWWSAAAAVVAGVAILVLPGNEVRQVAVNKVVNQQVADSQPSVAVNNEQASVSADKSQSSTGEQPLATNSGKVVEQGNKQSSKPDGQQDKTTNGKQLLATNTGKAGEQANKPDSKSGNRLANNSGKPVNSLALNDKSADNSNPGLSKLAQPEPASKEVVQQLQDKLNEQVTAAANNPVPQIMANSAALNTATKVSTSANKVAEAVTAPAPVQGELVVSVTMNGDSKLLNGVANVARFFSKKKK